jgi:hypothetical protein
MHDAGGIKVARTSSSAPGIAVGAAVGAGVGG